MEFHNWRLCGLNRALVECIYRHVVPLYSFCSFSSLWAIGSLSKRVETILDVELLDWQI